MSMTQNALEEPLGKPTISIRHDVAAMIDAAIAGVLENDRIGLYQRGGVLVRITRERPARTLAGPREGFSRYRAPTIPYVALADVDYLREAVDRSVRFVRATEVGAKKILPPDWVLRGILARGSWPFPVLETVALTPTLRDDGSVVQDPGFDARSGIFFDPSGTTFPRVEDNPTPDAARAALTRLFEVFETFPFGAAHDHVLAVAMVMTLVARPGIPGPVPCFAVTAPVPGAGKTLLAHAIANIATGRDAPVVVPTSDPEEERKRLLGVALDASPIVLCDNASGVFGSDVLAATLTSCAVTERILGKSERRTVPMRAVWIVTGNNLGWRGDLGRRVLPLALDPKCEHPEERAMRSPKGQDEDFKVWCRTNRGAIATDALTVLRAYIVAGRPRHEDAVRLGTFAAWDELVRGALLWLCPDDVLRARNSVRDESDAELNSARALATEWYRCFADAPQTIANVANRAASDADLDNVILEIAPPRKGPGIDRVALGYALRRIRMRVLTIDVTHENGTTSRIQVAFERCATVSGAAKWRLRVQ